MEQSHFSSQMSFLTSWSCSLFRGIRGSWCGNSPCPFTKTSWHLVSSWICQKRLSTHLGVHLCCRFISKSTASLFSLVSHCSLTCTCICCHPFPQAHSKRKLLQVFLRLRFGEILFHTSSVWKSGQFSALHTDSLFSLSGWPGGWHDSPAGGEKSYLDWFIWFT